VFTATTSSLLPIFATRDEEAVQAYIDIRKKVIMTYEQGDDILDV
jgi:hypothetical protein